MYNNILWFYYNLWHLWPLYVIFLKKSPVYYIDVIAGYGSYNITTYIIKKIKGKE